MAAYQDACKHGTKPSFRARINIVGHSGAGKTTLTKRLLGKAFMDQYNPTDGIEMHLVKFDPEELKQTWEEEQSKADDLSKEFNKEILSRHRAKSSPVTTPRKSSNPEQNNDTMDQESGSEFERSTEMETSPISDAGPSFEERSIPTTDTPDMTHPDDRDVEVTRKALEELLIAERDQTEDTRTGRLRLRRTH